MTLPTKLINILAEYTTAEHMQCEDCDGSGQTTIHDPKTGLDYTVCESCLGSGYNQLGMILKGILKPPEEGYGPVELQHALKAYLENQAKFPELSETHEPNKSDSTVQNSLTKNKKADFFSQVKTNVKNLLQKNSNSKKIS